MNVDDRARRAAQAIRDRVGDVETRPEDLARRERRATVGRTVLSAGAVAAFVAVLVWLRAGLPQPRSGPAERPQPTTTVAPRGSPKPVTATDLRPGAYIAEDFEVPFTFSVGEGWSIFASEPRLIVFGTEDQRDVMQVGTFGRVRDPRDPFGTIPAPADIAAFLEDHPDLEVRSSTRITVGGVEGQLVELSASEGIPNHPECQVECVPVVPVFAEWFGLEYWFSVEVGDTVQLVALEVAGHPILMVTERGSAPFLDRFLGEILPTITWLER